MRRGIDERGPIAAWLIRSRARFGEPGAKRQWTVDQFLAALKTESGYAPTRTARWESGAVRPEPENLQRVVVFYAARGVGGPDEPTTATQTPDPLVAALIAQTKALADLVAELHEWRTEDRPRLADVEATVRELVAGALVGSGTAAPVKPALPRGTAG